MGVLKNGVFGGFVNRTGGLVGRMVGPQNVISAVRHSRHTKTGTPAQLEQQLKFALVVDFLSRCNRLVSTGFGKRGNGQHAFNAALRYNFGRVIAGTWPDYHIDFSKVVYSRGCLAGPNCPSVSLEVNRLLVSWLPHEQSQLNQNSDVASFLVYSEVLKMAVMKMDCVRREALGYVLELPVGMTDFPLHVYMSFASGDRKERSNSVYLGVFGTV